MRSLVLAESVVPGATLARHCLRAALELGRFAARGRLAQLDMTVDGGDLQQWLLEEDARTIPSEFWDGGDFVFGIEDDGAGKPGERYARIEFDRDRIVAHWQSPHSVLEEGEEPLGRLIDGRVLRAGAEDNSAWFLGHDDVIVHGLNAAGQRETIDRRRLAMAPLEISDNTLKQGGDSWSFVRVALAPPHLVTNAPPPPPRVRGYFGPMTSPAPECKPPHDAKAQTATSPVDENVIAAWARPGIQRIVADELRLTKKQFIEVAERRFGLATQAQTIEDAWGVAAAVAGWTKQGLGNVKEKQRVTDLGAYFFLHFGNKIINAIRD